MLLAVEGASDDLVSCATMLEVLRIMALSETAFTHSVIFLFNGAEETGLQVESSSSLFSLALVCGQ